MAAFICGSSHLSPLLRKTVLAELLPDKLTHGRPRLMFDSLMTYDRLPIGSGHQGI